MRDRHFPTHGNWRGLSPGGTATLWLAPRLAEGDPRLNPVEPWAVAHWTPRRPCPGQGVDRLALTDDRLAAVLRARADDDHWLACESALTRRLLRVSDRAAAPVRLALTTAHSEPLVTPDGRFPFGSRKDRRPDRPPGKIALAALDLLGRPLATVVVPGNQGDAPLDRPLIKRVRAPLGSGARLYVGEAKRATPETRAVVHRGGDDDRCPLPIAPLPTALLDPYRAPVWAETQRLTVWQAGATPEAEPVAEGFEIAAPLAASVDGVVVEGTERRLRGRSPARAASEGLARRPRVTTAATSLRARNEPGRGKPYTPHRERREAAVRAILPRQAVGEWVQGATEAGVQVRRRRASRGQRARRVVERRWPVRVPVDEAALAAALRRRGWRVSATDAPASRRAMDAVVPADRGQGVIERGFERLKGRPLSLAPVYLQKEAPGLGLIRLLSIARRVLCRREIGGRRGLAATEESLAGRSAGPPRRATTRPTSEALRRAFRGTNRVLPPSGPGPPRPVTALSAVQPRILALRELPADTDSRLSFHS